MGLTFRCPGVARSCPPGPPAAYDSQQFWYAWAAQLQRYSTRYRCVAIDMRGFNDSDKPVGVDAYDLDILADDVRAVVEALGYRTCTLVAHDWGGVVAWYATPHGLAPADASSGERRSHRPDGDAWRPQRGTAAAPLRHVAALYPQLLEKLVVVNAPQASLWSRNVFSFPQLLKVRAPSMRRGCKGAGKLTRGDVGVAEHLRVVDAARRSRRTCSSSSCPTFLNSS